MIFCKKNQVYPLSHAEVIPNIPFERQSLLVQEQIAALGGELDSLSTYGGGDHVWDTRIITHLRLFPHVRVGTCEVFRYKHIIAMQGRHNSEYTIWAIYLEVAHACESDT